MKGNYHSLDTKYDIFIYRYMCIYKCVQFTRMITKAIDCYDLLLVLNSFLIRLCVYRISEIYRDCQRFVRKIVLDCLIRIVIEQNLICDSNSNMFYR